MALEPLKIDIEVNKANFEKQLKGAEQFARDTKKKINQSTKIQLEFNIANFQSKLAQVKKDLKTATWDRQIRLQIEANQLQRWLTEAKRNLNNLVNTWETSVSRLQAKFNSLKSTIVNAWTKISLWIWAAVWAVATIVSVFKWFVDEAMEWQRAVAQLWAVIKSTWGSVWYTAEQIKEMANELAVLNWVEDDVILSAQNMLLTFTNIRWETFNEATQAVLDLSTAMNWWLTPSAEQLAKTAIQVWKALNDPIKWVWALSKVWVTFTWVQKEQIKNFIKGWETAKAQQMIIAELNKEFGGSAQAQLQTYWWKVQQLSIRRSQFKEMIWNKIIPVLSETIDILNQLWWAIWSVKSYVSWLMASIPSRAQVLIKWLIAPLSTAISQLKYILWQAGVWKKVATPQTGLWAAAKWFSALTAPQVKQPIEEAILEWVWGWGWSWKSKTDEVADKLKTTFKSAFDSINWEIDKSKWKIEDYQQSIKDLTKDLADLWSQRDKDIASRVAEIDKELAKTWEEALAYKDRYKLEEERKSAFQWLTKEQTDALNAQIQATKDYNALSDIWKIQADYDIKKKSIEEEIALKQNQLTMEQDAYKLLNEAKLQMERDYTTQFKSMIEEQKSAIDWLMSKYTELLRIKNIIWLKQWEAQATSTTTNNRNTNNTFNVNSITLADYLAGKLSK